MENDVIITADETKTNRIIISKNNESKFTFKFHEKEENKNNENIFHLIYANQDSEAGKYYNKSTLDFIETSYQHIPNYEPYDVIETIKDRFIEVSKEIFEKIEKIKKTSFVGDDTSKIQLNIESEIVLKKRFIDELGFSNLKMNGFEPKYVIYKKDDKVIIKIEISGICGLKITKESIDNYIIIKIQGNKKKDSETEKKEYVIYVIREFGEFTLIIPIKEYYLSNQPSNLCQKNRFYTIE